MLDREDIIAQLRRVPPNAPALRSARKRISRQVASISREGLLGLAYDLIDARLPRFVAYELVLNHKPTIESITETEVEKLGEGIANWGDIDSFSCFIAGQAWRDRRLPDRVVRDWARSADWCWGAPRSSAPSH